MRIDEAGHGVQPAPVDLALAFVTFVGTDDPIAADRDVGFGDRAADDVKQPDVLDDQVGRLDAVTLVDSAREESLVAHVASQDFRDNDRPRSQRASYSSPIAMSEALPP